MSEPFIVKWRNLTYHCKSEVLSAETRVHKIRQLAKRVDLRRKGCSFCILNSTRLRRVKSSLPTLDLRHILIPKPLGKKLNSSFHTLRTNTKKINADICDSTLTILTKI